MDERTFDFFEATQKHLVIWMLEDCESEREAFIHLKYRKLNVKIKFGVVRK